MTTLFYLLVCAVSVLLSLITAVMVLAIAASGGQR